MLHVTMNLPRSCCCGRQIPRRKSEDHSLINGVHFADYIRRVDVPGSEFAYQLGGQQIRYLSVTPARSAKIKTIELVKGSDNSSPIVMAVTVER